MPHLDDLERWSLRSWVLLCALLSTGFALAFFRVWPHDYMFDDGAIVLRYMDHFAAGAFYRYNLADPPVFGVSGFVHAVLAGTLSASRLISPEASLQASNLLGVALGSWAVLAILRLFTRSLIALVAAWVFVFVASFYFLGTAFQGLEAPLHLGIVLIAVWAFLAGRRATMWASCALAVISKLDAVAVVGVLLVLRALSLRGADAWRQELRAALLWGAVPLAFWVGFTFVAFGSPLPQSAAAKLSFHFHPPSRIGFVTEWWRREDGHILAYGLLLLAGLGAVVANGRAKEALRILALPLSSAALLGLFMGYNPGERMPWYYVLPQVLLVLSVAVAVLAALRPLPRTVVALAALAALAAASADSGAKAGSFCRGQIDFVRMAEPERIAIGRYLDAAAGADDTVMTGYGHIARHARRYVHDASGLNSPQVTDLYAARRNPVEVLAPHWIVQSSYLRPSEQARFGYLLDRSFYRRSSRGNPAWRVWKRQPGGPVAIPVAEAEIETAGEVRALADPVDPPLLHVRSTGPVVLRASTGVRVVGLVSGVLRGEREFGLLVQTAQAGSAQRLQVPAADAEDLAEGNVFGFTIEVPGATDEPVQVEIRAEDGGPELLLLEPLWLVRTD